MTRGSGVGGQPPISVVGAAHLALFSKRDLPLMEPTGRVSPNDADMLVGDKSGRQRRAWTPAFTVTGHGHGL